MRRSTTTALSERGYYNRAPVDAVADLIDTHFFFLAIFVILGFRPA
jgi:hypothetical protein